MKKIIIDTDIGNDIDDTWALLLALSIKMFDIKMISVSNGDVSYKAILVAKILTLLDRKDIIIAKGEGDNYINYPQKRFIEDFSLKQYDGRIMDDYQEAYKEVLEKNPDCILIALAPFTTLAKIYQLLKFHDTPIYAMAGSIKKGYFNSNEISAECNIVSDIKASKIMFENDLNLTIFPLEVCNNLIISGPIYQDILSSYNRFGKIVLENYKIWQEDYEGGALKKDINVSSSVLYDLAPILYAIFQQYFDVIDYPVYIDEKGYTRIGKNNVISVATNVHKLESLLLFCSEQFSTNIESTNTIVKIGVKGRYELILLTKLVNPMLSVLEAGWEIKRPKSHYGPTKREHYILHFIKKGKGIYKVDNQTYEVSEGDCFLVPPRLLSYYEADENDPYTYWWIGFNGIDAEKILEKIGFLNSKYVIKVKKYQKIISMIEKLIDDTNKNETNEYVFIATLYLIISEMLVEQEYIENNIKDYVEEAIEYINLNYDKDIGVDDIARKIGIERTYFYRLFYKKMKESPQEYLIKTRIENAKVLLCNSSYSNNDIAKKIGYSNYASFIKIFKEKTGMTPSNYRKLRVKEKIMIKE